MKQKTETSCPYICIYESYMDVLSPFSDAERGRLLTAMLKQWGVEHRQPHNRPFVCIFVYLPCLAPARLRHLHKTPKQKSWLWGAVQFSGSSFSARQAKSRREYPLVFSRDFPQYWRKAAPVNLSGFNSPLLNYMYHGTEPEFEGNERFIWPSLKGQIDRDKASYAARCEANRENGKKGGRPKTQKTEGLISKPKKAKEKEKEKEKKKEKEKENENENEREISSGALSSVSPVLPEVSFCPPDVWEVDKYCREQGYEVDPWRFLDYYSALGWRLGNTPIRDWKALIRRWDDPKEHIPGRMGETYEAIWKKPCKSG